MSILTIFPGIAFVVAVVVSVAAWYYAGAVKDQALAVVRELIATGPLPQVGEPVRIDRDALSTPRPDGKSASRVVVYAVAAMADGTHEGTETMH